jgi:hypothetical protein
MAVSPVIQKNFIRLNGIDAGLQKLFNNPRFERFFATCGKPGGVCALR